MGLAADDRLHNCAHCRANGWQKDRGCPELGDKHPGIVYQVGEQFISHCLVPLITPESITWINEVGYLEAGILPEGGGLNNQYELDLRVFAIIRAEQAAIREAKGS